MPPHLYWGLVQLAERQILTLEVIGSTPIPPAKSRSIMDGTIYQSLKKVGRRIRSVHRLKSGAMRTADLRCNNTLLRFAVNRNQNRFYKKFDFSKNL